MVGTRSSAQKLSSTNSNSHGDEAAQDGLGRKRKAEASPVKAKGGKKSNEKKQKSIEETLPKEPETKQDDVEMRDPPEPSAHTSNGKKEDEDPQNASRATRETSNAPKEDFVQQKAKDEDTKANEDAEESKDEETAGERGDHQAENGTAVEEAPEREKSTPSSILEKGLIYFFFRGRVGIDEPSDVQDLARSYIVLRPLPHGAKLGDGPIGDVGTNRLLALPKKVLPTSGKDRFMIFVELAQASMDDIKSRLQASDYTTKTAGDRHTPSATPIGEGVYAITSTGRESHLAYILTRPSEMSEVQQDVGLRQRGSFVTSAKNPQHDGPANASLPQGPKYPDEILKEFRSLRWMPLQPKLLDYENTQFLVIGSSPDGFEKALEPQPKHAETEEAPLEEMEKLEQEDEQRVEHLKGDDVVFEDLGLTSKEYSSMQTTW